MVPAVFLDRDGTLIEHVPYLDDICKIRLVPFAAQALKKLKSLGYLLVVVSNQSGVARGYFDEAFVQKSHRFIQKELEREGTGIDAFYYCPHHPEAVIEQYKQECTCRKPAPGMVLGAVKDLSIDIRRSWVVGDNEPDLLLAENVNCPFILVRSGYGAELEEKKSMLSLHVVDGLYEAACLIEETHRRK
ncbi:MAG: HAD family hydrolase [Aminobacterium sp.]|jgi:D-glycero-D-manno-heptose 1,7-bisphosphate phosphatase|uniref:D-glycero-alpha-D-manno-heptose-1,7-bisphosphate 7-phosphatase n=1 Tax=Aminobacterium sp. MB27-C1 TaxID=3070661 RepID=UPI001BCCE1F0|nr:HAD family hydrolase [Aminobacterium sp. MB27-C1]MDD2206101.1 HAD family hydrolase [Aminobacterium sp.]MDD3426753.1 HAD family hydrolase [Aminobacterium sp.]WMI72104.1 HAD family hydrolase [Aminobacterium sp. MB27-C1]